MKPTLLVADDEIEIGEIIKTVAEDLGFEVTCVNEGSEVVALVNRLKPDVIVLDLRMPGSDGVEIIRELSRKNCKSGILLMSGMDQRTLSSVQSLGRENHLDIGSTLTKPMSLDAIETALSPYFRSARENRVPIAAQPTPVPFDFGLAVHYQAESLIRPLHEANPQRLRVRAQWHMDDNRVISAGQLTAMADECGIGKGLSKMVLAQALENVRVWSNQDFTPEISVQLDDSFLTDLSTPDVLAMMADQYYVPRELLIIEITEKSLTDKQDTIGDVLSRLRIKGFKIAVAVESQGENILPLLDNLPIDQIVIDITCVNQETNFTNDMELEFLYSSLTSVTNKKGITVCADNVNSQAQLSFVKKCNFNSARGDQVLPLTSANNILSLVRETKLPSNPNSQNGS